MPKEKIDLADLRELCRLVREIVKIQEKYIAKGFSCKEIAQTFARVYLRMFKQSIDPEIAAKICTGSHQQNGHLNNHDAAVYYYFCLSGEVIGATSEEIGNTNNHPG